MRRLQGFLLSLLFSGISISAAQDEERIEKLFRGAIETMGGETYLKVTDMVSEGNYFAFDRDGNSSGLIKYNDYTRFPDRSRNEIGNKKKLRDVTVFDLSKNEGWILEGQKETRPATPQEMQAFKAAVKHNLDNILRIRYGSKDNKLFYLGPGERADVRLEAVQIVDSENDTVTIFFDRISKLPAKVEFRSVDPRGIPLREVEEYSQWHEIQGVKVPMRVDRFINGRKSAQYFLTKMTLNNGIPDSTFEKPIPPK